MVLVDDGQWPLVVVNWPSGRLTNENVESALRMLASYYGRRHAVLHDGLRVTGMSAEQRRWAMQHSSWYDDEIRRWVVASAAVIESALWRGIIRVMQQVVPPPMPFRTFASRPAGEEWLLQALRRAGLWRPPSPQPSGLIV
jgi:hypothetical protein